MSEARYIEYQSREPEAGDVVNVMTEAGLPIRVEILEALPDHEFSTKNLDTGEELPFNLNPDLNVCLHPGGGVMRPGMWEFDGYE